MSEIIYVGFNDFDEFKRGVENVILNQCLAHEPTSKITYIHQTNESFFKIGFYEHEDLRIKCFGFGKLYNFFVPLFLVLKKLFNRNAFIHSHNALISALLPFKTDCLTVHDGIYYTRRYLQPRKANLFKVIERIAYKKAKKIHYISAFTKKNMLTHSSKEVLIYNTTPLESLKADALFDIPNDYILAQGRKFFSVRGIQERTRIDLLIDYAKLLKKRGCNDKIFVAGKGDLLEHYTQKIKSLGLIDNIELLGFVPDSDLLAYYNYCDAVIVTAEYGEGFGLPIIEGYLFDKPVFASNVCAMPEVICNKTYLFDNNVESMDSTISSHDFLRTSNSTFRSYYDANFSSTNIVGKYKDFIYKVGCRI